ncbi:MAG: hypothetical protein WD118_11105 [Phycisphaeraceae bacterium]
MTMTLAVLLLTIAPAHTTADPTLRDRLTRAAEQAAVQEQSAILGEDGWLFFTPELRHLGVGPFWGERAAEVSRAAQPDAADPLPAIVDFHEQLARAGIELVVVPVPAKATIYPDRLPRDLAPMDRATNERLDVHHAQFYEQLAGHGVNVLDLTPLMLAWRDDENDDARGPLYSRQDTHWSGLATVKVAEHLASAIERQPWYDDVEKQAFDATWRDVSIRGDLHRMYVDSHADEALPRESMPLRFVSEADDGEPVQPWRESPVLLVGDSHTLVYHVGDDMHARGAGLAEQLAFEFGFAPDVVGVRGSGATPSRIALLRRRDNLAGKRYVIWCFSVREFTEGQGWRKMPVIRE